MNGDVTVKPGSVVADLITIANGLKNLKDGRKTILPAEAGIHLHLAIVEIEEKAGRLLYLEAVIR